MTPRPLPVLLLCAALLGGTGCGDGASGEAAPEPAADAPVAAPGPANGSGGAGDARPDTVTVVERAERAREALAEKDFVALADLVHPERGVRFSPYGYVDTTEHVVLMPREVAGLASDTTTRLWGTEDGTGDPIRRTFDAYYDEYVYDAAYGEAQRGAPGEQLGRGNTVNNIDDAFGPEATFVEYYVPGTDRYDGMDWSSLRLVFAPYRGTPHLVGIVHGEWTI